MKNFLLLSLLTINAIADPTNIDKLADGYNKYLLSNKLTKTTINEAYKKVVNEEGTSFAVYKDTNKNAICHGLNISDRRYKKMKMTQDKCKQLTLGYIYNDYAFLKSKKVLQEINVFDDNNGKQVKIIHNRHNIFNYFKTPQQQASFLSFVYNIGATRLLKNKELLDNLQMLLSNQQDLQDAILDCQIKTKLSTLKIRNINTKNVCNGNLLDLYAETKAIFLSYNKNENGVYKEGLKLRRQKEWDGMFGL